jgi:hypothetical protein
LSRTKIADFSAGPAGTGTEGGRFGGCLGKKTVIHAGWRVTEGFAGGLPFSLGVYISEGILVRSVPGGRAIGNNQPKVFSWTLTGVGPSRPCGDRAATTSGPAPHRGRED